MFFPLFLNAYKGATTIDPDYQLLMHTMKAGRVQFVRMVTLPSTVPWLILGAKLASRTASAARSSARSSPPNTGSAPR